jgi:hypothetical protein
MQPHGRRVAMADYPESVAQLLRLAGDRLGDEYPDYLGMGLTAEHVPDLARMATDRGLMEADEPNRFWAPVHAWRALGVLRAADAGDVLVHALRVNVELDQDAAAEELPRVFELIGPPALPALARFLAERSQDTYARWPAATAIGKIGHTYPEARPEALAALAGQLEDLADPDRELNAGIVSALLDLKAVEAAPAIEKAFAAGAIREAICGDWEVARYELGLRPDPPPPRRYDYS